MDRWVLQIIFSGYAIGFRHLPPSPRFIVTPSSQVLREMSNLLQKGAVELVPTSEQGQGFYSRYFTVPKRDRGLRPILDLRALNKNVNCPHFRMTTIQSILPLLFLQAWLATIDLKGAYFHIDILPEHRKFLWFAAGNTHLQYCALSFGFLTAPQVLQRP